MIYSIEVLWSFKLSEICILVPERYEACGYTFLFMAGPINFQHIGAFD
jgi:hypothetical protein